MIKAICTWGDGPDVLLVNNGSPYMLYDEPSLKDKATHGVSFKGSYDLTVKEAIDLIKDLLISISSVLQLEKSIRAGSSDNMSIPDLITMLKKLKLPGQLEKYDQDNIIQTVLSSVFNDVRKECKKEIVLRELKNDKEHNN